MGSPAIHGWRSEFEFPPIHMRPEVYCRSVPAAEIADSAEIDESRQTQPLWGCHLTVLTLLSKLNSLTSMF